jgi:hypothetical protein
MTYEEIFNQINSTKDKYKISNLIGELSSIIPDENYIQNLIELTVKTFEIKTSAIRALGNFNCPSKIEDFIISKIETEKDKDICSDFVKVLSLNGTEKSSNFLLNFYKLTKSKDVKGVIIHTLENLYIRKMVEESNFKKLTKILGNEYPFFQGYWKDLRKAKSTTIQDWKIVSKEQLALNNLNLVFKYDSDIDFHLQIEIMNSNFIRYLNLTTIFKRYKSSFSKYYTPQQFYLSENRLFDSLFSRTKEMRPDIFKDSIINLVAVELMPKLESKILLWNSLQKMPFKEFENNQNSIFNTLYETKWDWVIAHQMTQSVDMFNDNPDKNLFIDFIKEKWRASNKESYQINHYLDEQKNSNFF